MTTMPPRISLWFALVAGLVAGATAVTEGRTWWLVALAVVGFGGSSGLITRRPWIGVAIMAAVVLGLGVLGMGADSSAVPLMPLILGVVAAGYLVPAPVSVLGPLALAGASLAFGPWDHGTVIFAFVLFLLPWGFGTVVRGRDVRRRSAEVEALRLALVDPTTRAESAAVLDREQYAASALTVVDAAVERMNRAAASAKESLDATAIETVRQAGTEATSSLKDLLLVLRDTPSEAEAKTDTPVADSSRAARVRRVLLSAIPIVVVTVLWWFPSRVMFGCPQAMNAPVDLAALIVVVGALLARRRWPARAVFVTAGVVVAGAVSGQVDPLLNVEWLGAATMFLAWTAGTAGTRAALGGVVTLLGVTITWRGVSEGWHAGNVGIQLVTSLLPYFAGIAWSGQLAAESGHRRTARLRQLEIDAAEARAVSAARLSLARDLHDAASHAVGTMMMQANVARVLRERDPDGARAALDTAASVGNSMTARLADLGGLAIETPVDLSRELAGIAGRGRLHGTSISVVGLVDDLSPDEATLVFRVVSEGVANAMRHAPGSQVEVSVTRHDEAIAVSVDNGPARETGTIPDRGTGHGLRGLDELVTARGGSLTAGPVATGGWRLLARFG